MDKQDKAWIDRRLRLAYDRLDSLRGDPSRAAELEADMHRYDIKELNRLRAKLENVPDATIKGENK